MNDVIVFDPVVDSQVIEGATDGDLLVVDVAATAALQLVVMPGDVILMDAPDPDTVVMSESGVDIVVITSGGPAGPPGLGTGYTHIQSTPSASWLVQHNLGCYPAVSVYVDGELGLADVEFIDLNTLAIPFPQATTGIAAIR